MAAVLPAESFFVSQRVLRSTGVGQQTYVCHRFELQSGFCWPKTLGIGAFVSTCRLTRDVNRNLASTVQRGDCVEQNLGIERRQPPSQPYRVNEVDRIPTRLKACQSADCMYGIQYLSGKEEDPLLESATLSTTRQLLQAVVSTVAAFAVVLSNLSMPLEADASSLPAPDLQEVTQRNSGTEQRATPRIAATPTVSLKNKLAEKVALLRDDDREQLSSSRNRNLFPTAQAVWLYGIHHHREFSAPRSLLLRQRAAHYGAPYLEVAAAAKREVLWRSSANQMMKLADAKEGGEAWNKNQNPDWRDETLVPEDRVRTAVAAGDWEGLPMAEQAALRDEYRKLAMERGSGVSKANLLTDEAQARLWDLREYDELLKVISEEEEGCLACRRNHRLLEQVWQTVSNWYFDQSGSFSQRKWAAELTHTLNRVHGSLRLRTETYRAAREMIAALGDRYSRFLSPAEFHVASHRTLPEELAYLAAQYTGVGMELGQRSVFGGFIIEAPFAGSPAEEAGILGGERLLAVDGFPIESFTSDEAVVLLRGPVGSTVALTVAGRSGRDAPQRRVVLERRALPVPPLRSRIIEVGGGGGGAPPPLVVSYVRLHYFTKRSTKLIAAAIREGEALGVDGYVLDLRNNPGGGFEEAIRIAGFWLDCTDCDVAATVRADSEVEELIYSTRHLAEIFPNHPGPLTHAPLVLIANRDSASASEVLTGALHDNRRALLVGEQTFGKGVIQYFFPMDDGSGLRLTVAKYLTPTRYDITKRGGLLPDIECGDYPRAGGKNDECIEIALEALAQLQDGPGQGASAGGPDDATWRARMPYRWMPPIEENSLWAAGK